MSSEVVYLQFETKHNENEKITILCKTYAFHRIQNRIK